jgi:hypothetical protein
MYYGQLAKANVATFGGLDYDLGAGETLLSQRQIQVKMGKIAQRIKSLKRQKARVSSNWRKRSIQARISRLRKKYGKLKSVLQTKIMYRGKKAKYDASGRAIASDSSVIDDSAMLDDELAFDSDELMTDAMDEIDDFDEYEEADNTMLYIGLGVAALAGLYFLRKKPRTNRIKLGKKRKNTRRKRRRKSVKSIKRRNNRR